MNLLVHCPGLEASSINAISRINSDDALDPEGRPRLTVYYRGNHAPAPASGPAPRATAGAPVSLAGVAPGAVSTLWTQISGPGPAAFSAASSPATSVTFPAPGDYVLRLAATNLVAETSATLRVTVLPAPTAYEVWQDLHWPGNGDATIESPLADPDADGLPNLLEFALGSSPLLSSAEPNVRITNIGSSLTLTFLRARPPSEVTYEVQATSDLVNWSVIATNPGTVGSDISVTDTIPRSVSGSRFLRLKVTLP